MKLKVMTYNIASGRYFGDTSKIREDGSTPEDLSKCTSVIKKQKVDICGINEIRQYLDGRNNANQTLYISKNANLDNFCFGKAITFGAPHNCDYGNAILSKFNILEKEIIPIPDPERYDEVAYYESRSITKIKLGVLGGITILQTHLGLAISEKQNAITTLCNVIDKIDTPIILMGDFNLRPNDFLLDKIRERLFDTALIRKDEYLKTFPTYKTNHPDCKIDYIFVSKHFKTLSIEVVKENASDHYPLLVNLEI